MSRTVINESINGVNTEQMGATVQTVQKIRPSPLFDSARPIAGSRAAIIAPPSKASTERERRTRYELNPSSLMRRNRRFCSEKTKRPVRLSLSCMPSRPVSLRHSCITRRREASASSRWSRSWKAIWICVGFWACPTTFGRDFKRSGPSSGKKRCDQGAIAGAHHFSPVYDTSRIRCPYRFRSRRTAGIGVGQTGQRQFT